MPEMTESRTIGSVSLEPCPVCDAAPKVLVAVRHPVMRRYAAELLSRDSGCWVSSEVEAGEMLPAAIARSRPDLLVVDAGDFPACCKAAIDAFPRDRVVVIGPEPDRSYGAAALADGAAACVTRDNVGEELIPTMRSVLGCRHDDCPHTSIQQQAVGLFATGTSQG